MATEERTCKRACDGHPRRARSERLDELPPARASCSRPSASSSARSTTSRCSRRWASATASRTTRAGSTAAQPGETPYTLYDYFPEDCLVVARREPRRRCRRSAACTAATARARRRWSSSASACPRRSTTGRCASTSGRSARRSAIYVSATPGDYELEQLAAASWSSRSSGPTGLIDPKVEIRPAAGQVDDLLGEIRDARRARASACSSRRSPSAWPRS